MPKGISFFYVGQRWLTLSGQLLRLILPGRKSQILSHYIITQVARQVKRNFKFLFRTFVRTEHMFFQIFIFVKFLLSFSAHARAVKFFHLSNFQISCKRAVKKLRPGAANELQIFSFFQIPRSCKFYELSNFKAPAQSHQKIKFEKATNFLYNIYRR